MREWRDIHAQLKELVAELGWRVSANAGARIAQIHRALLAGLLGNIGLKTEEGNYLGARGITLPDPPRLGRGQEGRALDHGGGAHRDHAPVRALRRHASSRSGWRASARTW